VEIPGSVDEIVERDGLDGALEGGEFVLFVFADDEVFGGESVFDRVLSAGFAFGGRGVRSRTARFVGLR